MKKKKKQVEASATRYVKEETKNHHKKQQQPKYSQPYQVATYVKYSYLRMNALTHTYILTNSDTYSQAFMHKMTKWTNQILITAYCW